MGRSKSENILRSNHLWKQSRNAGKIFTVFILRLTIIYPSSQAPKSIYSCHRNKRLDEKWILFLLTPHRLSIPRHRQTNAWSYWDSSLPDHQGVLASGLFMYHFVIPMWTVPHLFLMCPFFSLEVLLYMCLSCCLGCGQSLYLYMLTYRNYMTYGIVMFCVGFNVIVTGCFCYV